MQAERIAGSPQAGDGTLGEALPGWLLGVLAFGVAIASWAMPTRSWAEAAEDWEMTEIRWRSLSAAWRCLLSLMARIGFGRIEGLRIQNGEPILDPMPRIFRTIKLDEDQRTGAGSVGSDYVVRRQVVQLLERIDRLGNGTVASLEVQHGLPFRMVLEGADGLSDEVEP
jgi:hypothetical protein